MANIVQLLNLEFKKYDDISKTVKNNINSVNHLNTDFFNKRFKEIEDKKVEVRLLDKASAKKSKLQSLISELHELNEMINSLTEVSNNKNINKIYSNSKFKKKIKEYNVPISKRRIRKVLKKIDLDYSRILLDTLEPNANIVTDINSSTVNKKNIEGDQYFGIKDILTLQKMIQLKYISGVSIIPDHKKDDIKKIKYKLYYSTSIYPITKDGFEYLPQKSKISQFFSSRIFTTFLQVGALLVLILNILRFGNEIRKYNDYEKPFVINKKLIEIETEDLVEIGSFLSLFTFTIEMMTTDDTANNTIISELNIDKPNYKLIEDKIEELNDNNDNNDNTSLKNHLESEKVRIKKELIKKVDKIKDKIEESDDFNENYYKIYKEIFDDGYEKLILAYFISK